MELGRSLGVREPGALAALQLLRFRSVFWILFCQGSPELDGWLAREGIGRFGQSRG